VLQAGEAIATSPTESQKQILKKLKISSIKKHQTKKNLAQFAVANFWRSSS
jgi:hypothetical protein